MPLWIERYLIPICAVIVFGLVILNPLKFDWQQRLSLLIAISVFAYFLAHTVHKPKAGSPPPVVTPTDPRIGVLEQQVNDLRSEQQRLLEQEKESREQEKKRSEIQTKLAQLTNEGIVIRSKWTQVLGQPEDIQRIPANEVRYWHAKLENYIRTLPRSSLYLAKLNSATRTDIGYSVGMNMNIAGSWDMLLADLASLKDFINDPNLGKP